MRASRMICFSGSVKRRRDFLLLGKAEEETAALIADCAEATETATFADRTGAA